MAPEKMTYKHELRLLQIELVKLQRSIIQSGQRVLVIFEGRDASGKDGVIKRITAHLSPRETRVVALGKPSEREDRSWYFQRYVSQLPVDGELVLFNRSWYNRAGVEKVMGYCTQQEYDLFMETINDFEDLLIKSRVTVIKYYLDISRKEQKRRLAARRKDPLKQWKISPVDESAIRHWDDYSKARNEMLKQTGTELSPWIVVIADDKKATHLNVIRDILTRLDYPEQEKSLYKPDPGVLREYHPSMMKNGFLAN